MNKTLGGVAAIAVLTVFSGVAVAQTAAPQRPARAAMAQPVSQADFVQRRVERLRAADANHDGTVTADEMRAAGQAKRAERRAALFERLDANKDGSISRTEFEAPRAEGQQAQRAHRGPRAEHAGRGHRGGMHRGAERMGRGGEGRFPIVIAEAERKATEAFTRLDANRDGTLTVEERRAGMQARRAEMRQKRIERRAPAASPSTPASE
ncbi:EF-hand domain-containing protein [Brevundimonas sp.]|uniref:EF-hand domain-containing protein n=1 Tax=Brevundimonas sp. TaxID=1871086 RepID=UPI0028AF5441|nr:EF-hand domain-containing protein [Brevundimonas sp.]